jgi:hypothetical protein
MARFIAAAFVAVLILGSGREARAEGGKDATAILDKAIKALGGEEKLAKVKAATWKSKGTLTLMGNDNEVSSQTTVQGLDHFRQEFEGEFGGNKIKGVTVVAGDKGWRKFGENQMALDKAAVAVTKRTVYLTMVPITILPLKGKGFKVETAAEEKVDGKPAVGVKATGPDGKEFLLYFDKESGLPVKLKATVVGFMGEDFALETTYGDYKEVGGIKKATKYKSTRDGEKYQDQQVSDFKALDKADAKAFAEPE